MSIYYSGTFKRSGGLISAIIKQLKLVNLKPVKKIQVQFDPFHPQAETASQTQAHYYIIGGKHYNKIFNSKSFYRDFLFHISGSKVTATNLNCAIKTNIVCDRSDPFIKVDLLEGNCLKFLATNLTVLEILQQFNKHISSKVKPEELATTTAPLTKLEKKKAKRK